MVNLLFYIVFLFVFASYCLGDHGVKEDRPWTWLQFSAIALIHHCMTAVRLFYITEFQDPYL